MDWAICIRSAAAELRGEPSAPTGRVLALLLSPEAVAQIDPAPMPVLPQSSVGSLPPSHTEIHSAERLPPVGNLDNGREGRHQQLRHEERKAHQRCSSLRSCDLSAVAIHGSERLRVASACGKSSHGRTGAGWVQRGLRDGVRVPFRAGERVAVGEQQRVDSGVCLPELMA